MSEMEFTAIKDKRRLLETLVQCEEIFQVLMNSENETARNIAQEGFRIARTRIDSVGRPQNMSNARPRWAQGM